MQSACVERPSRWRWENCNAGELYDANAGAFVSWIRHVLMPDLAIAFQCSVANKSSSLKPYPDIRSLCGRYQVPPECFLSGLGAQLRQLGGVVCPPCLTKSQNS